MDLKTDPAKFKILEDHLFTNLENTRGGAYDNKAKMYEKLVSSVTYNKMMWGTSPSDYISFSQKAVNESRGTTLDIGCGGLVQTATLYAKSDTNTILLDSSIEMLKRTSQFCSNTGAI